MTAEIISVGTELLLGNILNTNAQYLSRELAALGITVRRQSTIGDNHGRLADFVNEAKQRCDLLVFTGGLGPTADDLTKETVAACFGDTLTFDPDEWQKIVDFFTRTGRETTPNNRKQAMVPVHGHKVVNHHGTAPGAWFEQDGRCAVLMPGVPHEMKAMWEESVRPLLLARQSCALHSLTLRVLGGESNLEYRVRALLENQNPTAAIYCKTGECEIRITARAQNDAEAQTMCRAYAKNRTPQLPKLGGIQLKADDKHQEHHAEFRKVEDLIDVANKTQPPRANCNPCQQISQHSANTQPRCQRHRSHRREEKQHSCE